MTVSESRILLKCVDLTNHSNIRMVFSKKLRNLAVRNRDRQRAPASSWVALASFGDFATLTALHIGRARVCHDLLIVWRVLTSPSKRKSQQCRKEHSSFEGSGAPFEQHHPDIERRALHTNFLQTDAKLWFCYHMCCEPGVGYKYSPSAFRSS